MTPKTRLVVGASENSDIVIRQPTVSKTHCELRWQEDGWLITDLDSTNGTFVDGQRIFAPAKLNPSSKVTLGREVLLSLPSSPLPTVSSVTSDSEKPPQSKRKVIGFVSLIPTILMVVILLLMLRKPPLPEPSPNKGTAETSNPSTTTVPTEIPAGVERAADKDLHAIAGTSSPTTTSSVTSPVTTSVTAAISETTPPTPSSPYWGILVQNRNESVPRLLGTAVAIGPHRLLTLAPIVETLEALKNQFPTVTLVQRKAPTVRIVPTKTMVHPRYPEALKKFAQFEADLNAKLASLGPLAEPSLEERLEWSERMESIMSEIASVELAVLECNETLPKYLSILPPSSDTHGKEFKLSGYPMILPSPPVQGDLEMFFLEGNATRRMEGEPSKPSRMIETNEFFGLPLLSMVGTNDRSEIVGIIVRQQPVEDINTPQVALFAPITEFWK